MTTAFVAVGIGLALLVWSADRFVEGATATARHLKMPPLMIGMVVVGFGTSSPELIVSVLAASQGNSGLALGNAYGSNIANISLILGVTAAISPIIVRSRVLRKELPILTAVTALAIFQLWDGQITRMEAVLLLCVFAVLMAWTIWQGASQDELGDEMEEQLKTHPTPIRRALFWLAAGMVVLIVSSRILVWGAVEIAQSFGVTDLIIGLTIVAIGTSLPELASSIIACRRNAHDIALGNVIGSNMFNTLAVVGLAGVIRPMAVEPAVFTRDAMVMAALTLSLFCVGYGFRGVGRINRIEGAALLACYFGYNAWLVGVMIRA